MLRFDHVGVNVEDFEAAVEFFAVLGFERGPHWTAEDETLDAIVGLHGTRAEAMMMKAPGGGGCLEVVKYHAPADDRGPDIAPSHRLGFRHISLEVDGLDAIVAALSARGLELVGELCEYGGTYRLCYVRGPEGLIVELAECVAAEAAA